MKQLQNIPQRNESGFTLIEVVLAVAIAAIGIIAILGLLPNAIQSGRDAADNTLSATVVQEIFSDIRSQPLNQVDFGDGLSRNMTNGTYSSSSPLSLDYDYTGALTNSQNSYYRVLVSPQQQGVMPLWTMQVAVIWPAQAVAHSATTNIFVTNITPYDP